jgi:PPK2 family polyphosphate:nucleotide phosphotransferase
MSELATRLDGSQKAHLDKIPTDSTGGMTHEGALARMAALAPELDRLQELLYAAGDNGLLIVLQGQDTAGKDGTIKAIAGAMNPTGVRIASFKVPTPEEASHDFLWRVHRETPGKGQVVFFNRSHYEDVLVTRVNGLITESVCERRYVDINHFERTLVDSGTVVVKFCLHISRDEQKKRLLARESDPAKAWKLNPEDWQARAHWKQYASAYEAALTACSTSYAPWYVVPADHKGFRNVAIAETVIDVLKPYRKAWEAKLAKIGETQRAALARMRAEGGVD